MIVADDYGDDGGGLCAGDGTPVRPNCAPSDRPGPVALSVAGADVRTALAAWVPLRLLLVLGCAWYPRSHTYSSSRRVLTPLVDRDDTLRVARAGLDAVAASSEAMAAVPPLAWSRAIVEPGGRGGGVVDRSFETQWELAPWTSLDCHHPPGGTPPFEIGPAHPAPRLFITVHPWLVAGPNAWLEGAGLMTRPRHQPTTQSATLTHNLAGHVAMQVAYLQVGSAGCRLNG